MASQLLKKNKSNFVRQGIIFPSDFGPNDSFVSWIFQSFIISDEDDMRKKINGKADTD